MPSALAWLDTAKECFADEYGYLRHGLLTSVFSLVIGMERVFHLDEMEDGGFARLCGGQRCPSRFTVGAWRRHLPWYEVDAFCRRTSPWHLLANEDVVVSFDEHTGVFCYVQPAGGRDGNSRGGEPIVLAPEPSWNRVAYRR